jgi:pimeloyl-ACP methyl ester carboxylesterase
MPGFARSERRWRHIGSAEAAIEYMTDWLQEWLKAMNIVSKDRVHVDIVGHSFGGYISAQLAMRRPDIVSHLFLADPWGVQPKAEEDDISALPLKWKVLATCFYSALPFSVLRLAGPLGPKLLPSLRPDFARRWQPFLSDPSVFFDYTYHCNASSQAVGEFLFQSCCHGLVCAKLPLAHDLPEKLPQDVALTLAYGTKTWMDQHAGYEMLGRMKEAHPDALRAFANVEGAGHQISTDNVAGFNQLLIQSVFRHTAGGRRGPRH